jgi:hypothetical protein
VRHHAGRGAVDAEQRPVREHLEVVRLLHLLDEALDLVVEVTGGAEGRRLLQRAPGHVGLDLAGLVEREPAVEGVVGGVGRIAEEQPEAEVVLLGRQDLAVDGLLAVHHGKPVGGHDSGAGRGAVLPTRVLQRAEHADLARALADHGVRARGGGEAPVPPHSADQDGH